jgi:large subunit ribosomal protein L29
MKQAEVKASRSLTVVELTQKAKETKEELFNLRFQLRTGHLSDASRLRVLRRAYAQIKTLIGEKRAAEKNYV